ncbi:hypothetical protein A2U01_0090798 [Trifolium medium]|uniref:Uncharacterized protein n=1 Tax=Trifolium medium TaxID=97028 RepID=A0A392UAV6_9FABA|nr:hypothetical protein [Trifolium medium]
MASISTCKPSAANKKRKGDNGSPCLKPRSRGNSSVGLPLTKTDAVAMQTHSLIHFLHRVGNDILPMKSSR